MQRISEKTIAQDEADGFLRNSLHFLYFAKMAGYGLETHDIVKNREIISCIKRGSLILAPVFPLVHRYGRQQQSPPHPFVHWSSLFSPRSSPFICPNNSRELKEMEFCLLWESNPRSKPNSPNIESAKNFGENWSSKTKPMNTPSGYPARRSATSAWPLCICSFGHRALRASSIVFLSSLSRSLTLV